MYKKIMLIAAIFTLSLQAMQPSSELSGLRRRKNVSTPPSTFMVKSEPDLKKYKPNPTPTNQSRIVYGSGLALTAHAVYQAWQVSHCLPPQPDRDATLILAAYHGAAGLSMIFSGCCSTPHE